MRRVYFIRDITSGLIKIGIAKHLRLRMSGIAAQNPNPIELLGCYAGEIEEEKRVHLQFSHLRLRYEWFRSSPELLAYITAHATNSDLEPTNPAFANCPFCGRRASPSTGVCRNHASRAA